VLGSHPNPLRARAGCDPSARSRGVRRYPCRPVELAVVIAVTLLLVAVQVRRRGSRLQRAEEVRRRDAEAARGDGVTEP